MTRIVIANSQSILRDGLTALLDGEADVAVVGQAADGIECVQVVARLLPEIVLMDVCLPGLNGIEATRRVLSRCPQVKVICLDSPHSHASMRAVIDAGARGFLPRSCTFQELVRAIRAVGANQMYLSPTISQRLIGQYRASRGDGSAFTLLTSREREITQLLSEGLSTKEIAARLHVSIKTVGTHREHIMLKLSLRGIAELTRYAIREGLSALDAPSYDGVSRTQREASEA